MAGKVQAQYVELADDALRVPPCEVSSHDAAANSYEVALTNGHTGKSVTAPRVQLMFDGEDQQTFVDRFTAALAARDAAVQDLQYKLCIKDEAEGLVDSAYYQILSVVLEVLLPPWTSPPRSSWRTTMLRRGPAPGSWVPRPRAPVSRRSGAVPGTCVP